MVESEQIIAEGEEGTGPGVIRAFVRNLPNRPGVYRMVDAKGDVIYVGKARSLKSRVVNYTRLGGHTNRISAMIAHTRNMEFVTTETEAEAETAADQPAEGADDAAPAEGAEREEAPPD